METKKEASGAQVGMPLSEFEATVETVLKLKEEGRHFLFLVGAHSLKLIGDVDKLRIDLGKKLGRETLTRRDADRLVDEVITIAQVCLAIGKEARAVRVLEENVFKDELRKGKGEGAAELREIVPRKVALVASKLISRSMRERSKRLSQMVGPRLSDVEIDLISQRDLEGADKSIATPFLRLGLRYSEGNVGGPFFGYPPWMTEVDFGKAGQFDLECDESDIDLLIYRLLLAKRLLAQTIQDQIVRSDAHKSTAEERI